ncbi:glycoside hydrolase domain-containing protein [Carboxylicivirga sp. N1Y90]|uniref:DUF4091 domain-containing protein n=1 Tax=Carboxylicivirga fragile TaxID=3417571 RepID=UPI003D32FAF7|nr:DUF4091 domain-containing protein [Marinilabiliaceae bacterium N1Y90]
MNWFIRTILFLFLAIQFACINQRPDVDCETYAEANNPDTFVDPLWAKTGRGLHASIASTNMRYKSNRVPMEVVTKEKHFTAWRGERVSSQIVLWSVSDIKQVECEWSAIVSEHGDTIAAENLQTRFIRYVLSDNYGEGCGSRDKSAGNVSLRGDLLEELPGMQLAANTVRPMWLNIDVPRDVTPGIYRTSLFIYSHKNSPQELRFTMEVLEHTLPEPSDWNFHLNLKQDPLAIADWHRVEAWSEEHFEQMRPYYALLALAGQKGVSCDLFETLSKDTRNGQKALVSCKQLKNGKWQFNYSNFEQWIEYMNEIGIDAYINVFSLYPKSGVLNYYSELTTAIESINLDTSKLTDGWLHAFMKDFAGYLKQKAWFDKTSLVIEDTRNEHLNLIVAANTETEANFSLNLAAYKYHPEALDYVNHIAMSPQYILVDDIIKERRSVNKKTSLVITCENERPNLFTFSEPAEASWLAWYAALHGLDGLYYESFNVWEEEPYIDSRTDSKPAGADYLIYPGAKSSIRFERLIEGIQDYEKIRLLSKGFNPDQKGELNDVLSRFSLSGINTEPAHVTVDRARLVLENLAK